MVVAADIRYATGVENAWSTFMEAVPKIIAFVLILLIGFLVARVIGRAVTKVLRRVGFERFVQRGAVRHAMAKSTYDASQLAGKLAYYAAALLTLVLAFGVFGGDNAVSRMLAGIVAFIPKLAVAIVIVLIAAAIAGWVKEIVSSALGGLSYGSLLGTVASGAILVTGIFMALSQLLIAPAIVTGLYYAVLAVIVGVTVVAVGGGGIAPMRARWERALATIDEEGPRIKEYAQQAKAQRAAYKQAHPQVPEATDQAPAEWYGQQPYPTEEPQYAEPASGVVEGAAMPPDAYTTQAPRMQQAPGYPSPPTIDLTEEELRRQGVGGGFVSPAGEPGVPPAGPTRP
jgi:hypothetical protein